MKTYRVTIAHLIEQLQDYDVDANSVHEAEEKALAMAQEYNLKAYPADCTATTVEAVRTPNVK